MVKRRNRRPRRRNFNTSLVKVAVIPMTVNYRFTASGNHDIHPATASSNDKVFRASSIDVIFAVAAPTAAQIVLYNEDRPVMQTMTLALTTQRRVRLRAPKYLDYDKPSSQWWRIVLAGPGLVTGTATFTSKETLDGGSNLLQVVSTSGTPPLTVDETEVQITDA